MDAGEPEEITVELRLSGEALAARISGWLERTGGFVAGAPKGALSVTIADHIPDDAEWPVILLAEEAELALWPPDPRVAARLTPASGLVRLRIAIEAAAHGLSISEAARKLPGGSALLSGRELDVLRHLAEGASNKAIARSLGISAHTVKFHVAAILEKLGAATRTEAAMHAIRLGLLMI